MPGRLRRPCQKPDGVAKIREQAGVCFNMSLGDNDGEVTVVIRRSAAE